MARVSRHHQITTALTWPVGIAITAWAYLWRTTPIHRRETVGTAPDNRAPRLGSRVDLTEIQVPASGVGPLFHRRYHARIRNPTLDAKEVIARIARDPNVVAPASFARFVKTHGQTRVLEIGDEYVVRMPGPWGGPVRVVDRDPQSFRPATLDGHLEAGQIEFRASGADTAGVLDRVV